MARHIGPPLPAEIARQLRSGRAYRPPKYAVVVLTLDARGWPHVAMTSGVCLNTEDKLVFPLRRGSTSLGNLQRDGRATLLIVLKDVVLYVKGTVETRPAPISSKYDICILQPVEVLDDLPPDASIDGITYEGAHRLPEEWEERKVFEWICVQG